MGLLPHQPQVQKIQYVLFSYALFLFNSNRLSFFDPENSLELEAWLLSSTGKSMSEALIFASTNPQYDNRLFIVHENCKLRIPAEHVVYTNCCFCFVLTFRTILVHNMFCRCCELLKNIYLYLCKHFLLFLARNWVYLWWIVLLKWPINEFQPVQQSSQDIVGSSLLPCTYYTLV